MTFADAVVGACYGRILTGAWRSEEDLLRWVLWCASTGINPKTWAKC